jgi:S-formylglutathione hydrolase FrmB
MWNQGSFSAAPRQQQQHQQVGSTSPVPPPWRWQADQAAGLPSPQAPGGRTPPQGFGSAETQNTAGNTPRAVAAKTYSNGNVWHESARQCTTDIGASSFVVSNGIDLGMGAGDAAVAAAAASASSAVRNDGATGSRKQIYSAEDSGSAWKHIKKVIGDGGKTGQQDLHNLLSASPLESSYSFNQAGVSPHLFACILEL